MDLSDMGNIRVGGDYGGLVFRGSFLRGGPCGCADCDFFFLFLFVFLLRIYYSLLTVHYRVFLFVEEQSAMLVVVIV